MQLYSHTIRLRISGPALDPDLVTTTVGLSPLRTWRVGEPRRTPKGTPLQGTYSDSYWIADPFEYGWRSSTDCDIEGALEELIAYLEPKAIFLQEIAKEGGRLTIWISSQSERNYAIELPPGILGRLASLEITLAHDVYPGP